MEDPPEALANLDPGEWDESAGPESTPGEESPTIEPSMPEDQPAPEPVEAVYPEAGDWEVSLATPGTSGDVVGDDDQAGPVAVGIAEKSADGKAIPRGVASRARGKDLRLTVHDRAAAERAGVTGFVFEVEGDGSSESAGPMVDSGEVPLELSLDYSGFADAYGPGFASQLRLVALPACALEDPVPAGCDTTGVPVTSRNDTTGKQLLVDQADLAQVDEKVAAANAALQQLPADAGSGFAAAAAAGAQDIESSEANALEDSAPPPGLEPWGSSEDAPAVTGSADHGRIGTGARSESGSATVFAVTAAAAGDLGTYEATPMSTNGEWSVSPGTGEFSYGYPIGLPAPPAGQAPSVGLSYSSGAVDGLTHSSNPQASPTGLGWSDFANAYIERGYESCAEAEVLPEALWGNLCFKDFNATISLGGVSGRLIPIDEAFTLWRVQGDPGWTIERTAAPDPNQQNYLTAENWKVTAPDGTQYFFGLHSSNPDASATTNSVWWVPVTSDHAGEPCWNTTATSWDGCNMAYRWMLDRVVDPDGNLTTYYYDRETNNYRAWPGLADKVTYIRSGTLKRIEYGGRAGAGKTQKPAVKVSFDTQNRCWYLVQACGDARSDRASAFFDVPTHLLCDLQATCTQGTPTFFSGKRYSAVRVEVLVGTEYKLVSQHNLAATHAKTTDENGDSDEMMYLSWAEAVGTGAAAYPKTTFEYTFLKNVVSRQGPSTVKLWRARLLRVNNPYGGQISVTYSTDNCPSTYQPPGPPNPNWSLNEQPCFPQLYKDKKTNISLHGIFHKYRVMKVEELPRFGADTMVTRYDYLGGAGWAHAQRWTDADQVKWGWTAWRGYGEVIITKGTSSSGYSKTRLRLFRGMDNDLFLSTLGCPCLRRNVFVPYLDGSPGPEDHWWMAGRVLEEQQLGTMGTATDTPLTSTRYSYVKSDLIDPIYGNEEFRPTWSAVADVTERVWSSPTAYRERGTSTTYNANFQPTTTVEKGWLDSPDDDRCSVTTYADNPGTGMFSYPAVNETRTGGDCVTGTLLSRTETYYDDLATLGAAPTRGNATRTRSRIDGTRWSESTFTYDNLGRPLVATDPAGARTTTVYTPSTNVIPTKTEVTNHLGHKTTTEWDPLFAAKLKETDANGNVTTWKYDTLGRTTEVRRPSEQTTVHPSIAFTYTLDQDDAGDADLLPEKPPVVKSSQLQIYGPNGAVFENSWGIYDGFLRERQSHSPSPEDGKVLVSETRYDARGLVREEISPEPVTGTAGSGMLAPTTWLNRTRYVYDELGRQTRSQWMTPGSTTAVESEVLTTYGTETVTVKGPDGMEVRETADGLGRTVRTEEKDGANWVATQYVYDLADNLTKVVDPAGNETSYTYNMAGWRLTQADPDRGAGSFDYDVAGRATMAEDAAGQQIHNKYDILGRPTERRADSPTGTLLASWTYDSVKKGLATSSTRHTDGGNWVTTVDSYDDDNRVTSTTLTVPAGIPGLSGTYTVGSSSDRADHPYEVSYPAVGGLPAETLRIGNNGFGLPATLTGASEYVRATAYDGRGRAGTTVVGPKNPSGPYEIGTAHVQEWDNQQRLQRSYTWVTASTLPGGVAAEHKPSYRKDGMVTSQDSSLNGLSWRECYGYDNRARLTSTYTVANGAACTEANRGGGDQPFDRSYKYSADGKLEERRTDGVTTAYQYPTGGTGSVRPHAPTQVGTQSYTWNADGSLATRSVPGGTETFNWDVEHLLSSISGPSGTTGFVYGVDGQRLLRTDPGGTKTLYFAGHEVTANPAGTTVTAVRSYTHNGKLVATRSPAGVDYLVSNNAGSVEASLPSGATTPSGSRRYDPYGQVRSETGSEFATDRGFLGQIEDPTTNLSYLNARYYDTEAALFVSADPLFDTSKPKSLNPYTYGLGNPVSFSDPSGLASTSLWGTEVENNALRGHIKNLEGIITQMGAHIAALQSIIRKQQKVINDLIVENNALRSIIAQQQAVIGALRARVVYLAGQVALWQGRAAYWRGEARRWYGKAMYYKGVIGDLVGVAYRPQFRQGVLNSIWAGRGVPSSSWLGSYAALSMHLQSELQRLGRERSFNTFKAREMGTTTLWNLKSMPGAWQQRFDKYWNAETGRSDLPMEYETKIPFKYERGATVSSYGGPANVFEVMPASPTGPPVLPFGIGSCDIVGGADIVYGGAALIGAIEPTPIGEGVVLFAEGACYAAEHWL